jgi:hypothetical protein
MSFKIVRLGGTTLETRFIDMMNLSGNGCAMKNLFKTVLVMSLF